MKILTNLIGSLIVILIAQILACSTQATPAFVGAMTYTNPINALSVMSNNLLASGSILDNGIEIWNTNNLVQVGSTLLGHSSYVTSVASLPNFQLASASDDTKIMIWNTATATLIKTLSGHTKIVNSVIYLTNGYIASASDDGKVFVWKWFIGEPFIVATLTPTISAEVVALADLKNGKLAAGCSLTIGKVVIWNLKTGSQVAVLSGHTSKILTLAYLDNNLLASGAFSGDNSIRIWNTETGVQVGSSLTGHTESVYSLALLPSGLLASGSYDNSIRIWNITTQTQIGTPVSGHTNAVRALVVLNNGFLCSGSRDNTIRIWNTQFVATTTTTSTITATTTTTELITGNKTETVTSMSSKLEAYKLMRLLIISVLIGAKMNFLQLIV